MQPNDEKSYSREVRREVDLDPSGNPRTSTTQTTETVHSTGETARQSAFHKGYASGRISERDRLAEQQDVRENNSAARGLLLGLSLAALAALVGGTLYYLNQSEANQPVQVVPVPSPQTSPASRVSPSPKVERNTTIIERIVPSPVPQAPTERIVPVPVPQPSQSPSPTPNINITVPESRQQQDTPKPTTPPAASSPSSRTDINITVPNSQQQVVPSPEASPSADDTSSSPEASPSPSASPNDNATGSGTTLAPDTTTNDTAAPTTSSGTGTTGTTNSGAGTGAGGSSAGTTNP